MQIKGNKMNKMNKNTVILVGGILSLALSNAFAGNKGTNNEKDVNFQLNYFCGKRNLEIEETTSIGDPVEIKFHQGGFMQINTKTNLKDDIDALKRDLKETGISPECTDYLLTYGRFHKSDSSKLIGRISFKFNKSDLTSKSRYILEKVQKQLKNSKLLLAGNTDSSGKVLYNFNLGLKRSKATKAFFTKENQKNTKIRSYGEMKPIVKNNSDLNRQKNRRVEITTKD